MTTEARWTWMQGRTIQGLDGRYIARIWRLGAQGWDMPKAARFLGGRLGRGVWEIEGYGSTPDEAIADLRSRFKGRISDD